MEKQNELAKPELSRNALQKVAMNALYVALTYIDMGQDVDVQAIVSSLLDDTPYEECDYFVKAAVVLFMKHRWEMIEIFNANMRRWTFDRLNRVEQAILLLSYVHFFYIDPSVDKAVCINIAIRLTKEYCSDGDHRFVNAILDKVLTRDE